MKLKLSAEIYQYLVRQDNTTITWDHITDRFRKHSLDSIYQAFHQLEHQGIITHQYDVISGETIVTLMQ